jgi:hypothetical protein
VWNLIDSRLPRSMDDLLPRDYASVLIRYG